MIDPAAALFVCRQSPAVDGEIIAEVQDILGVVSFVQTKAYLLERGRWGRRGGKGGREEGAACNLRHLGFHIY